MYTQKHHEVQKYTTVTDHGYIGYAVIANRKFWEGLPPDIRATLDGAMKDATKFANDIAQKENDEALEGIRKSGRSEAPMPGALADVLPVERWSEVNPTPTASVPPFGV